MARTRQFTFRGTSLKDHRIESNIEDYYHQMRDRGFVPVAGTEDISYGKEGEYSVDWVMKIIGQECDHPWDVRYFYQDGSVEWFTTHPATLGQS